MLLSPYLFPPESNNPTHFETVVSEFKAWYFWAQVLEMGTAVAFTHVTTSEHVTYFIIDPSVDNHPALAPEEFLNILTGHEESGKFWGYGWTILQMSNNWHLMIQERYPGQRYSLNDFALLINWQTEKIDIIPKSSIWEAIGEIDF